MVRPRVVGGKDVCVIGAVTEETPALVSPAGITDVDFGDPVDAINRVVDEIRDDCDVLVATLHEGAAEGMPEGATLEEEIADSATFAKIVNGIDADVDAIFTGHTHKQYAWKAPVPGQPGKVRPVVQTGQYGEFVGHVVLGVDPTTNEVSLKTLGNVRRVTAADSTLLGISPRVVDVRDIVQDALRAADVIGRVPKGEITADITRALGGGTYVDGKYTGGTSEQRQNESTLGNLVGNALRDSLSSEELGAAEIGVVNPGGLRADLTYAGTGTDGNNDGVVTFAEANAVLPFVNNLWTLTLTGAQFKAVLEQQWQPAGSSRPFLHLGLSDNVSVTYDPTRTALQGRVTSVFVDGEPLDLDRDYRIGTFSFLAVGGDNFTAFAQATDITDTGLVDRDGWISYLETNKPTAPAYDRRQVAASSLPTSVAADDEVSFTLGNAAAVVGAQTLNLNSLGAPANTTVEAAYVEGGTSTDLGSFPVAADGTAPISFTAPATVAPGSTFTFTAQPSGTVVTVPGAGVTIPPSSTTVSATSSPAKVQVLKTKATVTATVSSSTPVNGGTVEVREGDQVLGTGTVAAGKGTVSLPVFSRLGAHTLTVRYLGDATHDPSTTSLKVTVSKAKPKVKVTKKPKQVKVKKTRAKLTITVTSPGQSIKGYVAISTGGEVVGLANVKAGKATFKLPKFSSKGKKKVTVVFLGGDLTTTARAKITIRVVR